MFASASPPLLFKVFILWLVQATSFSSPVRVRVSRLPCPPLDVQRSSEDKNLVPSPWSRASIGWPPAPASLSFGDWNGFSSFLCVSTTRGTALLPTPISDVHLQVSSDTLKKINGKSSLRMHSVTSADEQDVCLHFQRVAFNFSMPLCVCVCVYRAGGERFLKLWEKLCKTPNSCPHGQPEIKACKVLASGARFKEVTKKSVLKMC